MSESNLFAAKGGFTVHFKIVADELPALMKNTELFIDWMKKNGYEHDTTRDKPGRGGGFKKPETPPPADLPVPECDGESMEYREDYTNKDGKPVSARYTCRKGAGCSQARNGYGRTVWEDAWRKEQQLAVGGGYEFAADNEELPFE